MIRRRCGCVTITFAVLAIAMTGCESRHGQQGLNSSPLPSPAVREAAEPRPPLKEARRNASGEPSRLDLSLPPETAQRPVADWEKADQDYLPNLFDESARGEKGQRLDVGGRLLLSEEEQSYREAVEGGEISIEWKTR